MGMPYEIGLFDGPGTNKTAFKIYPGGFQQLASAEEIQVWQHVQELAKKGREQSEKLQPQDAKPATSQARQR